MKKWYYKPNRITSFIALICIVATLFSAVFAGPMSVLSSDSVMDPYVTHNGEKVQEITIRESEKVTLQTSHNLLGKVGYRWQIMDKNEENRWIDISGIYTSDISVTYALIGSLLSPDGSAMLRCRLTNGEKELYTTEVKVTVSFDIGQENSSPEGKKPIKLSTLRSPAREHETCSIVINYLFDNNAIAFEPYGASIAKGSDFAADIQSPKVVGYAPVRRVGENYVDASVVSLDLKNVQENITINVIYEPALVNFSVHHHLQNLLDDDYSVHYDLITTSKALTGSTVGDGLALTEEQLPGFKSLEYEHLTVAADGSTVIEIRYDRNYYLVDFDMNGGYGTEPVYTRYGATVGANNPIRHGYVFGGWELVSYGDNAPTNEQKTKYAISSDKTIIVPEVNLKYRAIWITRSTEYTMVFWKENPDDTGYTYWGYLDGLTAMSGDYVDGKDLISNVDNIDDEDQFSFNSQKTDKHVLVEGDGSTVVNVYYTRKYYKLTFKAPGLCTIPENHTHGENCYRAVCDLGHTHNEECVKKLSCKIPEHTEHTDDCVICGKVAHIHGGVGCDCKTPEHTHVKTCWGDKVGDSVSPSNPPKNPENGQIYSYRSFITRIYCIYIKGTWYRYSGGGASSGDILNSTCGYDAEHLHGEDCTCDAEQHVHINSCYKDSFHTHEELCYTYSCGQVSHQHSDDCLQLTCGITEGHDHSSSCEKSSSSNVVKTVYAKYQQSLKNLWPVTDDNGVVYNNGERWKPSSYYSQVLVYISKMPPASFTLTLDTASYNPYTMNYYQQVLPGGKSDATYGGKNYQLSNVIKAKYNYVTKAEDFFDIAGFVQYASSPSFSSNGQISISGTNRVVNFYYDRITDHYLEFNNNGTVIDEKTKYGIMYGAPIKEYNFTPDYPDNLEPGAYTFAGWYISPGCFAGTEVDWDTITMEEGDMMLYAKWAPVTHTVKVFKDATLKEQIGSDQTVDHKAFAHQPEGTIVNGNYVFQGWFYMDEGVEKAFVFTGIPIIKDMNIYAKWSSHVSVDYKINYVLHGSGKPVAEPTVGSAIAGHNKTFDAKAGDQLFAEYRSGFYPLVNSHTITMSVDGVHEFTFEYVFVEKMPYIVEYVDSATGEVLFETKKVEDNSLSVVTETFVRIDGKMPDAYQKRLILSASGEDKDKDGVLDQNRITFYYNSDAVHAYYRVVHYIQNISGDTYREYRSTEFVGEIGKEYTVDAITLTGFAFAPEQTVVGGVVTPVKENSVTTTLSAEGLLIELYYNRVSYDYTVRYLDAQGNALMPNKIGSAVFGYQVPEYAYDLKHMGYELVSDNLKLVTISADPTLNVIDFIYQERVVSLKYQIVGPSGCGTLSQYSENLNAISGRAVGTTPTVSKGFIFMGWFSDAACTVPVDSSLVDENNKLLPIKDENSIWTSTTYYAKYNAERSSLTITTTNAYVKDSQSFLFRVVGKEGTDTEGVNLTVAIHGNDSVTVNELPIGDYTISEISGWAWRYADSDAQSLTLEYSETPSVVTFVCNRDKVKWLDGNAKVKNLF